MKRRSAPKKAHRNLAKSSVHPIPLKKFAVKKEAPVKVSSKTRSARSGPIKGRAKVVASRRSVAPDRAKDADKSKGKARPDRKTSSEEKPSRKSSRGRVADRGKIRRSASSKKGKSARPHSAASGGRR